jgi:adenosylcobinamide-phosphate synthase
VIQVLVLAGALLAETRLRLPNALHPVAWLGSAAGALVARAPLAPKWRALSAGAAIALVVPAGVFLLARAALSALAPFPVARAALELLMLYTSVCLFGLLGAARDVLSAMERGDIELGRARLTALCSRDPSTLDAAGVANGTIASLAENLTDAVIAPLCALLLFGVEGALAYRAINTLDAMIGYRGRYEWLGKPAARLDDLVNLLPGRLAALSLFLAGAITSGVSVGRGARIWSRDRRLTPSPNGGHPMAMAAGLLGVRIDKPGSYVLGHELALPQPRDVERAIALVRRAGLLAFALALLGVAFVGLGGVWGLDAAR